VTQSSPGTVGSPPVEPFISPVVISPAFIIPVVVSVRRKQVAKNAGCQRFPSCTFVALVVYVFALTHYHKNAQLCFACRSRAKVSSFPLADRLAERMRACRSPAK
jgi:hypothetical protein